MNWHEPLHVSRALVLQLGGDGWMSTSSVSREPQRLGSEALPVLEAFATEVSPRQALESLRGEWEVEEEEFASLVERLMGQGLLVASENEQNGLAAGGFASVLSHFHMIRDRRRVEAYRAAIERHSAGRRVVEVGCGSGILSLLAARAGARSVVAIEESEIVGLAREMVAANGVSDEVELVSGNSRDVSLEEPGDVLIHELFGADPFEENFLAIIADARERLLVPGGRLIPHRLEVAFRGFATEDTFTGARDAAVGEARGFAETYGLDFGPLARAVEKQSVVRFMPPLTTPAGEPFGRPLLTAETALFDLDLATATPADAAAEHELELVVEEEGLLGGILIYFRAHMDEETVLSTSPLEPPTHWGWNPYPLPEAVEVKPGDRARVRATTRTYRGAPRVQLQLLDVSSGQARRAS